MPVSFSAFQGYPNQVKTKMRFSDLREHTAGINPAKLNCFRFDNDARSLPEILPQSGASRLLRRETNVQFETKLGSAGTSVDWTLFGRMSLIFGHSDQLLPGRNSIKILVLALLFCKCCDSLFPATIRLGLCCLLQFLKRERFCLRRLCDMYVINGKGKYDFNQSTLYHSSTVLAVL